MTKYITINERAAVIAIETCFGKAGLAAITMVYDALNEAEAAGRDDGYNDGFASAMRVMQPEPGQAEEQVPYTIVDTDRDLPPQEAEALAAEAILYGK